MKEKDLTPARVRSPFSLMRRLSDDMERMFDEFDITRPFALARQVPGFDWLPAIELFQKDNTLFVRADLPGLTKDDVKIEVDERMLTIEGERKQEMKEEVEGYITTERAYGSFFRQIALPEGASADAAKATFTNGVLEIQVPVAARKPAGARKLTIEEPQKEKALAGV
jgi:HSP20 family protein